MAAKLDREEDVVHEFVTNGRRSISSERLRDLVLKAKEDLPADTKAQFLGEILLRAPDDFAIFDVLSLALVTGRRAGFAPVLSGGAPGKNLVARVYEHFNAEIDASATVGGAAAASNTKTAQEELLSISKMLEGSLVEVFRAAQRHDEDKKRG